MRKRLLIGLGLAVLLLAACSAAAVEPTPTARPTATAAPDTTVTVAGGSYTNISPGRLAQMLQQKDFFFVNVHTPYEGEIANTDAQIPYDQTADRLKDYPADKDAPIVLYCRSGRMSAIASEILVKAGYTHLFNLDGGMVAWERAGQKVEK